ncbi:neural cell adhesion molecule 1-like isoform X4 [Portunus trituberculatus]|uniref:neural cell adhesion molecule 1-like isoform X4 n=1 Tax=Portunus trituberculatus TaxID=210409 RepID=UPI001E1CDE69|nr:neural cell adhesion molecule 1-like isoform X4 [Portunus trituberculatus]
MGTLARPSLLVLLLGLLSVTDSFSFYNRNRQDSDDSLLIMPTVQQQSVFEGASLFVSCSSKGNNVQRILWTGPEGNQITDYKGSLTYSDLPRIHVEEAEAHNGVDLIFDNILRRDRGNYTCSANVDGEEVSKSFQLFVDKKIDFLDTPAVQYLEEGFESELMCDITGDPEPTVSWSFEGKKISYGDKYSKVSETSNNLIVSNVTLSDAGTYVCKAVQVSPRITEMKDKEIDVKVHHKPLWNDDKTKAYSYVDGSVNLTCEVKAEPEANFTWTKDDSVIYPSEITQIFNDNNTSILQLKVTEQRMFGDYLCIAQNKLGTLERVIILQQGQKPAIPTAKVTVEGVDRLELSINAKNHPEMPIVGYRVQYMEAGEDWSQAQSAYFKKASIYVLENLKNDTPYVLRVASKNAAGFSDYSVEVTKRTEKIISSASTSASFSISSCVALLLFLLVSASLL